MQRDANILADAATADRSAKRRALERIKKETVDKVVLRQSTPLPALPALKPSPSPKSSPTADGIRPETLQLVFADISRNIVRCFGDPVEKVRELSVGLVTNFCTVLTSLPPHLPLLIPALSLRLGADPPIPPQDLVETSEETRLALIRCAAVVLSRLCEKNPSSEEDDKHANRESSATPYTEDLAAIVSRGFSDPYPEVKKETCKLAAQLCASGVDRRLKPHVPALVKSLIPVLSYRHATVRAVGVEALAPLLILDATPLTDSDLPLPDILRTLSRDASGSVREATYACASRLLLEMPDRYSLGYKIVPLVVAGCADANTGLRKKCEKYMDRAAELYEKEWEDRVKDQLDYGTAREGAAVPRPGLLHLCRDHAHKVIGKLVEGLRDWSAEVRLADARTLTKFLEIVGQHATGYAGEMVGGWTRALAEGQEAALEDEISRTATLLGHHVLPNVLLPLLLPHLTPTNSSQPLRLAALRVLASVVRGIPAGLVREHHRELAVALGGKDCCAAEVPIVVEVSIACVEVAAEKAGEMGEGEKIDELDALEYYAACVKAVAAVAGWDSRTSGVEGARKKASSSLTLLSHALALPDTSALHDLFLSRLLSFLAATTALWIRHSPEPSQVRVAVTMAGGVVGKPECVDSILGMVAEGAVESKEFEVRESILTTFHDLLSHPSNPLDSRGALPTRTGTILRTIILPNAAWKPGKKAILIRRKVMQVALAWFRAPGTADSSATEAKLDGISSAPKAARGSVQAPAVQEVLADLVTVVNSNADDDDADTRRASVGVWDEVLGGVGTELRFTADTLKSIYPELLKRLDDAHDDVRIQVASRTWPRYFDAVARWRVHAREEAKREKEKEAGAGKTEYVETEMDSVHWEAMVKGLAIHADDSSVAVQEAAATALAALALCPACPPEIVVTHMDEARARHRTTMWVDGVKKMAEGRVRK